MLYSKHILPMGYSPALETKYITPCETDSQCSTLRYFNYTKSKGWDTDSLPIESRRFLYWFNFYPMRNKNLNTSAHEEDCRYLICTGCHKPTNAAEANKINKVLGFEEPKRVVIPIDLEDFDF